jgi:hypothetical protein
MYIEDEDVFAKRRMEAEKLASKQATNPKEHIGRSFGGCIGLIHTLERCQRGDFLHVTSVTTMALCRTWIIGRG